MWRWTNPEKLVSFEPASTPARPRALDPHLDPDPRLKRPLPCGPVAVPVPGEPARHGPLRVRHTPKQGQPLRNGRVPFR